MSEFSQKLQCYQQRVDSVLTGLFATEDESRLLQAMRYGALLGGKRLRPYLVYATGSMLSVPLESLDTPAAAIECIHAYSLIHDDLPAMDDDPLRRGHPTCHIHFDEATATLAGDALQTLAFTLLASGTMPGVAEKSRLQMIAELATASGIRGMCLGQSLDLAAEGRKITLAELETIHRHKTGVLIRAAVRLGALAAGTRTEPLLPLLDRYANAIGLAFQVQDDILDVIGETSKTGKQRGSDQNLGKNTYPALLGIDSARAKAWDLYQEALLALSELAAHQLDVTPLQILAAFIIDRDN
ncbi:MAG: (2E,6E)-farnesyl diphosphate synthase [Enterobacteriaceae bacterium]